MDHFLPYIAGFFDGEGCISVQKHQRNGAYALWVSITNVNPVPLQLIKEYWGGGYLALVRRQEQQSDIHRLYLSTRLAGRFIVDVLPYLIIKKPQAELALRYLAHVDDCNVRYRHIKGKKGVQPLPPDTYILRDEFLRQMQLLNKRGRVSEAEQVGDPTVLATGLSITE